MKTFKTALDEVAQPLSQGEKSFKGLHNPVKADKLVPGVTDQEHVFKGLARKMDQPTASYEIYKSEDESKENYDKGLKVKEEPYAEEVVPAGDELAEMPSPRALNKGTRGRTITAITKNSKLKGMKQYRAPGEESKAEKRAGLSSTPGYKEALAKRGLKEAEEITDEELNEVLTKKTPASKWIHDFVHSDNPKFAGKSTKQRQKMALAAYYAKQNEEVVKEDVDYDYEGEMAKTELRAVCDKADKLANMMTDDMHLEAWLQSKISRAKDHIDAVYDYMMYKDKDVPAAVAAVPSQASSMAGTYGSFLNRMGEEVEQVDEKSLAALAPPKDKVTKKDILVGRGVLKQHPKNPDKHVLAKEENLEIKSPALRKAFEVKL